MMFTLEEFRAAVVERVNQLRSGRPPMQRVESAGDMDIILVFEVLDFLLAREQGRGN